jgi:hypothetical protein
VSGITEAAANESATCCFLDNHAGRSVCASAAHGNTDDAADDDDDDAAAAADAADCGDGVTCGGDGERFVDAHTSPSSLSMSEKKLTAIEQIRVFSMCVRVRVGTNESMLRKPLNKKKPQTLFLFGGAGR